MVLAAPVESNDSDCESSVEKADFPGRKCQH